MPLSTTPPIAAITTATTQATKNCFMDCPSRLVASDYSRIGRRASRFNAQLVAALTLAMLHCNAGGALGVLRRVDVKEGVDRLVRPVGDGDAMPRRPHLNLVQAFLDQR